MSAALAQPPSFIPDNAASSAQPPAQPPAFIPDQHLATSNVAPQQAAQPPAFIPDTSTYTAGGQQQLATINAHAQQRNAMNQATDQQVGTWQQNMAQHEATQQKDQNAIDSQVAAQQKLPPLTPVPSPAVANANTLLQSRDNFIGPQNDSTGHVLPQEPQQQASQQAPQQPSRAAGIAHEIVNAVTHGALTDLPNVGQEVADLPYAARGPLANKFGTGGPTSAPPLPSSPQRGTSGYHELPVRPEVVDAIQQAVQQYKPGSPGQVSVGPQTVAEKTARLYDDQTTYTVHHVGDVLGKADSEEQLTFPQLYDRFVPANEKARVDALRNEGTAQNRRDYLDKADQLQHDLTRKYVGLYDPIALPEGEAQVRSVAANHNRPGVGGSLISAGESYIEGALGLTEHFGLNAIGSESERNRTEILKRVDTQAREGQGGVPGHPFISGAAGLAGNVGSPESALAEGVPVPGTGIAPKLIRAGIRGTQFAIQQSAQQNRLPTQGEIAQNAALAFIAPEVAGKLSRGFAGAAARYAVAGQIPERIAAKVAEIGTSGLANAGTMVAINKAAAIAQGQPYTEQQAIKDFKMGLLLEAQGRLHGLLHGIGQQQVATFKDEQAARQFIKDNPNTIYAGQLEDGQHAVVKIGKGEAQKQQAAQPQAAAPIDTSVGPKQPPQQSRVTQAANQVIDELHLSTPQDMEHTATNLDNTGRIADRVVAGELRRIGGTLRQESQRATPEVNTPAAVPQAEPKQPIQENPNGNERPNAGTAGTANAPQAGSAVQTGGDSGLRPGTGSQLHQPGQLDQGPQGLLEREVSGRSAGNGNGGETPVAETAGVKATEPPKFIPDESAGTPHIINGSPALGTPKKLQLVTVDGKIAAVDPTASTGDSRQRVFVQDKNGQFTGNKTKLVQGDQIAPYETMPNGSIVHSDAYKGEGDIQIRGVRPNGDYEVGFTGTGRTGGLRPTDITSVVSKGESNAVSQPEATGLGPHTSGNEGAGRSGEGQVVGHGDEGRSTGKGGTETQAPAEKSGAKAGETAGVSATIPPEGASNAGVSERPNAPQEVGGTGTQGRGRIEGPTGRTGKLYIIGEKEPRTITYRAVEANDLIPSHDARQGFKINPLGDKNERAYHDPMQAKDSRLMVEDLSRNPQIERLTTDNPDSANGPPIMDAGGVVGGGNGRAMGIQLGYSRGGEPASRLRQGMIDAASKFGLDPAEVGKLKNPVIVREVDKLGPLGSLSRALNEPSSVGRTAAVDAVSRGKLISQRTAESISALVSQGDKSLRDLMADPKTTQSIIQHLAKDGAWSDRDDTQYFDPKSGSLNPQGKLVIEDALLGRVVDDPTLIGNMEPKVRNNLIAALGHITEMAADPKTDIRPEIKTAVESYNAFKRSGMTVSDYYFDQQNMFNKPQGFGDVGAASLVSALDEMGTTKFRNAMSLFKSLTEPATEGLLGKNEPMDRTKALYEAFGKDLDGPGARKAIADLGYKTKEPQAAAPTSMFKTRAQEIAENEAKEKPAAPSAPAGKAESEGTKATGVEQPTVEAKGSEPEAPKPLTLRDRIAKAQAEIAKKGSIIQQIKGESGSLSLDDIKNYALVGAGHILNGIDAIKEWSNKMADTLGEHWTKLAQGEQDKIFAESHRVAQEEKEANPNEYAAKQNGQQEITTHPEEKLTGIRNSLSEQTRKEMGMTSRDPVVTKDFETTYDNGKRLAEQNPSAIPQLLNELKANPKRILTDDEAGLMTKHRVDQEIETHRLYDAIKEAGKMRDPETQEAGRLALAAHQSAVRETIQLLERTGTESGRSLNARRILSKMDYSLGHMTAEWEAAKGAELNAGEHARLKQLYDELQPALEKERTVNTNFQKRLADAHADLQVEQLKRQAAEQKINDPLVKGVIERARGWVHTQADAARARAKAKGGWIERLKGESGELDPQAFSDAVLIGADHAATFLHDKAGWAAEMVKDLTDKIKPHLDKIWDAIEPFNDKIAEKFSSPNNKEAVKNVIKPDDILGKMKDRVEKDGLGVDDLGPYLNKLALKYIREGIKTREPLIDALHKDVQSIIPSATREQTRDALSGFGKSIPLPDDAAKLTRGHLKQQMQKLAQIEHYEKQAALPPDQREMSPATGPRRLPPDDETRMLQKKATDLRNELGITSTDPATQLKSRLDSMKTATRNRIKDLQTEIDTKQRIIQGKAKPITDAELDGMRKELADVKQQHEAIFGKKQMTDEQRLAAATTAAQRNLESWQSKLKDAQNGVFSNKTPRPKLSGPELDAIRASTDAARDQYDELKKLANPPKTASEIKEEQLQKRIDAVQKQISTGTLTPENKTKFGPDTEGVAKLKEQRDSLNKVLQKMRQDATPSAPGDVAKMKMLQKRIDDVEQRIKTGSLVSENRTKFGPESAQMSAFKHQLETLNNQMADLRKNDPVLKAKREAEAATKSAEEYERKTAAKEFDIAQPKPKPAETPETQRRDSARAEYERQRDADPAYQQQKNAQDNADYRTRIADQKAKLLDRIAKGDYGKNQTSPLQLDTESQRARADVNRVKQQFDVGRKTLELKSRPAWVKAVDLWPKLARMWVLSGPNTLIKLPAATLWNFAFKPASELAGTVFSHLPVVSEVFKDAPTAHDGFSPKFYAKSIADAFTTGLKGSYDKLFTKAHMSQRELANYGPAVNRDAVEFFGFLHGAIKEPAKQFAWRYSFEKRMQQAIRNGENVADPMVQMVHSLGAEMDAQRSVFQEKNLANQMLSAAIGTAERQRTPEGAHTVAGQLGAAGARAALPVVSVPTNIIAQTFESALGLPVGLGETAWHKFVKNNIDTLSPERKDQIARHITRGSVGAAIALLALSKPGLFGGFYQQEKKKDQNGTAPEDIKLGDTEVPQVALDNPYLQVGQSFATAAKVANEQTIAHNSEKQGAVSGALAAALGLIEKWPLSKEAENFVQLFNPNERNYAEGNLAKTALVPQALQWAAKATDRDAQGNPIQRKPGTIGQAIESGIPGLRQNVPVKESAKPEPLHLPKITEPARPTAATPS